MSILTIQPDTGCNDSASAFEQLKYVGVDKFERENTMSISKKLGILNILFYILIIYEKFGLQRFSNEYSEGEPLIVYQSIIFIVLVFSSFMFEEVYNKKIKRVTLIAGLDFFVRVLATIYHVYATTVNNFEFYNIIIFIAFLMNMLLQLYLIKLSKNLCVKEMTGSNITQKEINNFIDDFLLKKHKLRLSYSQIKEVEELIKKTKVVFYDNIFTIVVVGVVPFLCAFIYEHFSATLIFYLPILALLTICVGHMRYNTIRQLSPGNKEFKLKAVLSSLGVVTASVGIFIAETYIKNNYLNLRALFWMLSVLLLVPILKERLAVRRKLEDIVRDIKEVD